ncbi:hypothetical protein Pint_25848 [Pistacia integerrima]|uniref:Uncharacterized protein n=1 Tax=Pistacia integerrima TaxID=434235 RepID=A0ACC0YGC6_9ROSI|nr:hypothetical protein Pint_25848 [Pistacia integerrima]
MSIAESIKALFASIISRIPQRSGAPPPSQTPSSSPSTIDLESQEILSPQHNGNQFLQQWRNVVMTFCFTSALEIALLFAQIQSQLPVSFHILSFLIFLIFLFLIVANIIGHDFTTISQVLELVSVILVATTVVFTIAIPFPLSLKCVTWALI